MASAREQAPHPAILCRWLEARYRGNIATGRARHVEISLLGDPGSGLRLRDPLKKVLPGRTRADAGTRTPNLPLTRLLLHANHGGYQRLQWSMVIVLTARMAAVDVSSCHKWCHAGGRSRSGVWRWR